MCLVCSTYHRAFSKAKSPSLVSMETLRGKILESKGLQISFTDPEQDYCFHSTIYNGRYGQVVLAKDSSNCSEVAIKMIDLDKLRIQSGEDILNDVINEIILNQSCSNPNIVQFKRSYFFNDEIYVSPYFFYIFSN